MRRLRLLYTKSGNSCWMSHLDVMRMFQRAFVRAGIDARHTEGFNPHLYLSIAQPLPVGMESECELLDFESAADDLGGVASRLNRSLPEGMRAIKCYEPQSLFKNIAFADWRVAWTCENEGSRLNALFASDTILVMKKTKEGPREQNIAPLIRSVKIEQAGPLCVCRAVLACGGVILNPSYLTAAAFADAVQTRYLRTAFLDAEGRRFE